MKVMTKKINGIKYVITQSDSACNVFNFEKLVKRTTNDTQDYWIFCGSIIATSFQKAIKKFLEIEQN